MTEPVSSIPKISVVIPVYNERETIETLLVRVSAVRIDKEILVVDDGSTDGTRELLQDLQDAIERGETTVMLPKTGLSLPLERLRLFFQSRNRGKGAAVRRGFHAAEGEIVLVQDADLEYSPEEYKQLLAPIEDGRADVVYGSRFLGGPHRVLFFWHHVGNSVLTTLSNMFTNLNMTDVWTCYKVFRREALRGIELVEDRFGFEPEVTAKIARGGWRVYEVPISYAGRTYAEGKKISWKDGLAAIWFVLRYNILR